MGNEVVVGLVVVLVVAVGVGATATVDEGTTVGMREGVGDDAQTGESGAESGEAGAFRGEEVEKGIVIVWVENILQPARTTATNNTANKKASAFRASPLNSPIDLILP